MADLRKRLKVSEDRLEEINDFLLGKENPFVNNLLDVVDKYGGVDEINRKAKESGKLENLQKLLEKKRSLFIKDLDWLIGQRDREAFVSVPDFRREIAGKKADSAIPDQSLSVTLEISAFNFFPWLIEEAKRSIAKRELMPSRYIRVRSMREQVEDDDIIATAAAMHIIGASFVQTLDTKGTVPGPDSKPVNVHLFKPIGEPGTITGYFGGVGEPNEYALKWVDEYLHYYTEYGLREVLNMNIGTVLLGYLLRKLGIDIEFKISVFLGVDNPYSVLWMLIMAKLLSREDESTPLVGFNLSNSVNNKTIELAAYARRVLGFEDEIRIEHHITEAYKSIVRQPYDRTGELLEIADHVKNIGAKHEGGSPDTEKAQTHPSDILDYFLPKKEIIEKDLMATLLANYLNKHEALNRTAVALTRRGFRFIAAQNLHRT